MSERADWIDEGGHDVWCRCCGHRRLMHAGVEYGGVTGCLACQWDNTECARALGTGAFGYASVASTHHALAPTPSPESR